uniref:Uncharacterized protein n=1 Tax=Arundo donax TaxID=35708 RepID=A0A0A9B0P8_ARUDO
MQLLEVKPAARTHPLTYTQRQIQKPRSLIRSSPSRRRAQPWCIGAFTSSCDAGSAQGPMCPRASSQLAASFSSYPDHARLHARIRREGLHELWIQADPAGSGPRGLPCCRQHLIVEMATLGATPRRRILQIHPSRAGSHSYIGQEQRTPE